MPDARDAAIDRARWIGRTALVLSGAVFLGAAALTAVNELAGQNKLLSSYAPMQAVHVIAMVTCGIQLVFRLHAGRFLALGLGLYAAWSAWATLVIAVRDHESVGSLGKLAMVATVIAAVIAWAPKTALAVAVTQENAVRPAAVPPLVFAGLLYLTGPPGMILVGIVRSGMTGLVWTWGVMVTLGVSLALAAGLLLASLTLQSNRLAFPGLASWAGACVGLVPASVDLLNPDPPSGLWVGRVVT